MKEEYAKSTTKNISKSLKDYEEQSTSARRDRSSSADQISALSTGAGHGRNGSVPPNAGGNKASKVCGGSKK